jgi:hypothetical protein
LDLHRLVGYNDADPVENGRGLMAENIYKSPRVYAIVAGIGLFLILLMVFFSLSQVVKSFGSIFLFLPDQLGIIQMPTRAEIATVDMSGQSSTVLKFERPGLYTVYTNDYDLLVINDELIALQLDPWLKISAHESGQAVKVDYVERGLRLYDTPLAKGRPIHIFFIQTPGVYEVQHLTKDADIYLLPDYMTGNEDLVAFAYISQIAILMAIGGVFYRRKTREQTRKVNEVKQLKKIGEDKSSQFWQEYQHKSANEKNKHIHWR